MAIRITCPGCHARFSVSDQFAGRTGPCPKCKASIEIPEREEEVVVHAPEQSGPKDSAGRAVLKPVFRQETRVSAMQWMMIGGGVFMAVAVALVMRFAVGSEEGIPLPLVIVGAVVLSPACVWAGYTFLRNQELDGFHGTILWTRVGLAAAAFALLWIVFPVARYALNADEYTLAITAACLGIMMAAGAGVSFVAFDFDYLMGAVHFGMYLIVALSLRWLAGMEFLPIG